MSVSPREALTKILFMCSVTMLAVETAGLEHPGRMRKTFMRLPEARPQSSREELLELQEERSKAAEAREEVMPKAPRQQPRDWQKHLLLFAGHGVARRRLL